MKRLSVLTFAAILLAASGAYAAEALKVAVVDFARVINDSKDGKAANAEFETLVKSKQAEVNAKAAALENAKNDVDKESDKAAKQKKDADLRKVGAEYQTLLAASQAEVQKKGVDMRNALMADILKVVEKIGAEDKYSLIVSSETAPYFQKSLDITDKVTKRFDEFRQKGKK
ncbi:MAG: OmpH family outer membrane protein [Desulfobacteraceae bacterium]|nr:OmpH family outer membrane protein [Desulfobacteraceae bacterium]